MINNFTSVLETNDLSSLWSARKQFDNAIENAFSGSPTLQKEMKVKFRNAIQDFIKEKTPNQTYAQYMDDMSSLYKLKDLVQIGSTAERGLTGVEKSIDKHKKLIRLGKGVLTTAGVGGGAMYGLNTLLGE
jgi:hypothetical protein